MNDLFEQILRERDEAVRTGLCVECQRPAADHCYSDAGRREFRISGMCEECFDKMTAEIDSEEGST